MFDVRPGDGFGIFTVIRDYYGDSRIVPPHAVYEILKLIVTQESLRSYGNEGTDIILCEKKIKQLTNATTAGVWFTH